MSGWPARPGRRAYGGPRAGPGPDRRTRGRPDAADLARAAQLGALRQRDRRRRRHRPIPPLTTPLTFRPGYVHAGRPLLDLGRHHRRPGPRRRSRARPGRRPPWRSASSPCARRRCGPRRWSRSRCCSACPSRGWAIRRAAGQFFAGWLTEYSLSLDNLFIFVLLIGSSAVPKELHSRVLLLGVVMALMLRGVFIAVGRHGDQPVRLGAVHLRGAADRHRAPAGARRKRPSGGTPRGRPTGWSCARSGGWSRWRRDGDGTRLLTQGRRPPDGDARCCC